MNMKYEEPILILFGGLLTSTYHFIIVVHNLSGKRIRTLTLNFTATNLFIHPSTHNISLDLNLVIRCLHLLDLLLGATLVACIGVGLFQ